MNLVDMLSRLSAKSPAKSLTEDAYRDLVSTAASDIAGKFSGKSSNSSAPLTKSPHSKRAREQEIESEQPLHKKPKTEFATVAAYEHKKTLGRVADAVQSAIEELCSVKDSAEIALLRLNDEKGEEDKTIAASEAKILDLQQQKEYVDKQILERKNSYKLEQLNLTVELQKAVQNDLPEDEEKLHKEIPLAKTRFDDDTKQWSEQSHYLQEQIDNATSVKTTLIQQRVDLTEKLRLLNSDITDLENALRLLRPEKIPEDENQVIAVATLIEKEFDSNALKVGPIEETNNHPPPHHKNEGEMVEIIVNDENFELLKYTPTIRLASNNIPNDLMDVERGDNLAQAEGDNALIVDNAQPGKMHEQDLNSTSMTVDNQASVH